MVKITFYQIKSQIPFQLLSLAFPEDQFLYMLVSKNIQAFFQAACCRDVARLSEDLPH